MIQTQFQDDSNTVEAMMKRWNAIRGTGVVAGMAAAVAISVFGLTNSKTQAVDQSQPSATTKKTDKLIVHEWGTFTSFSGSNGVQLDFRPLINEDLPKFVLDRRMQSGVSIFAKGQLRAPIRMETPVTYFYTDVERTVKAKVEFPDGLLTEFYPPVVGMQPTYDPVNDPSRPFGKSMLDWGDVHLIPAASLAPVVKDEHARQWLQGMIEQRVVPNDGTSNHYYHARATDSAFVHVRIPNSADPKKFNFIVKPTGDHLEKFLFYRGVGRFEQPLQTTVADDGKIQVTNSGDHPIRSLFRVTVAGNSIKYSEMESLSAGATANFADAAKPITSQELQDRVAAALVREKLYPREATAMVKTWAESWFAEEGTRVFYMLPQEITDKRLPLTISPKPDETVRVLVGRVEVMTPSIEKQLLEVVRENSIRRAVHNEKFKKIKNPEPMPIPTELLKLGRLVEPALVRVRELAPENTVSHEATLLLRECRAVFDQANKVEQASVAPTR
jgi:hypothetical protein